MSTSVAAQAVAQCVENGRIGPLWARFGTVCRHR
jgi:hypothetical protein